MGWDCAVASEGHKQCDHCSCADSDARCEAERAKNFGRNLYTRRYDQFGSGTYAKTPTPWHLRLRRALFGE